MQELQVEAKQLTPADVWRDKDEFVAREKASYEAWESMPENEREAILGIIEGALDRLRDTVQVWVPSSLAVQSGSCLDVKFRLMFTDIADEIQRSELVTNRSIAEAAAKTAKLVKELEDNG